MIPPILAQAVANIPAPAKAAIDEGVVFFQTYGFLFKFLSVMLTIFFVASIIYFINATGYARSRMERFDDAVLDTKVSKRRSTKAWRDVQKHVFTGDENSLKIALLEADKLLDEALKLSGVPGSNLGDRLKSLTESDLPNLQMVWEAHKLRNRLAHEQNFTLNRDTAERALTIYEEALKTLGLIE